MTLPLHVSRDGRARAAVLLLVVAAAGGCAPRGEAAGGAADEPSGAAAAAGEADQAVVITSEQETDASVEGTITFREGGTLSATAADGTTFELVVPPDAVAEDTLVRVTPLRGVGGLGTDGPIHAVLLEPDGLEFYELVRLTITPAQPIPIENQLMFEAEGDGANAGVALIDPASEPIALLLQHFSVAGIATADEAQRARILEKSAATAERRLNTLIRERIGAERYRQLAGEDVGSGSITREALDAIAAEYQREVLDKRRAAAKESCRALREYVFSVIRWEQQMVIAGLTAAEAAASQTRLAEASQYAQSRYDKCEAEAIAACKQAGKASILVDFWKWIDAAVDEKRAKEVCEPQGFALKLTREGIAIPSYADSDGTWNLEGELIGCPSEAGAWEVGGTVMWTTDWGSADYPGAQSGREAPEEWHLLDMTGSQLPASVSVVLSDEETPEGHASWGEFNDNVVVVTDALGEPTATVTLYDGYDDLVGTYDMDVSRLEPTCEPVSP